MRPTALCLLVLSCLPACALTTAPTDTPPSAPMATADEPFLGCAASHAHGAVLAWSQGAALVALDADGTARVLDPGGAGETLTEVVTDGAGRIALHRQRREGTTTQVTYRLLGADGAPVWSRAQTVVAAGSPLRTTRTLQRLAMGAAGTVFAQHAHWDGMRQSALEWIAPDGASVWREGVDLVQTLRAGQDALVQRSVDGAPTLERWEPAEGRVSAFGPPPGEALHRFELGARTVELRAADGAVIVAVVDGPFAPALRLPFASLAALSVAATHPAGVLLLSRRDAPDEALRVDVARGTVTAMTLRFGPALRRVVGAEAALDDEGGVLLLLRDDRAARVYRTMDGQRWSPLGRPFAGTLGAELRVQGDAAVVYAHDGFFGGEAWPDAAGDTPDTLRGVSLQVLRRGGAHNLAFAAPDAALQGLSLAPTLSADGGCVAWATARPEEATVEVVNLRNGARRRFAAPSRSVGVLRWL